ncbi:low temperature requirement protein A [Streptomyces sp. L7]
MLFFDLVLAFGVGQIAHLLAGHPTWPRPRTVSAVVLVPLWWAWVDVVMAMNAVHETNLQRAVPPDDRTRRLRHGGCRATSTRRPRTGPALHGQLPRPAPAHRRGHPQECALYTIHPYRAGLAFALVLFAAATLPAPGAGCAGRSR